MSPLAALPSSKCATTSRPAGGCGGAELAVVGDLEAVSRRLVEQNPMESGAHNRDAETGSAEIEAGDRAAVVISEGELARRHTRRGDAIGKAERGHDPHAV